MGTVEVRLNESAADAPLMEGPCSTRFWIPNAATCTCAVSTRESDDRMALATKWEVCIDQSDGCAHLPKEALQHHCLHSICNCLHLRIADITSRVLRGGALLNDQALAPPQLQWGAPLLPAGVQIPQRC